MDEKEWRRMNLEWERRRRDAREEDSSRRRRDEEERRHRMELRQRAKDEEANRRRVEERRRNERVGVMGTKEGWIDAKGNMEVGGNKVSRFLIPSCIYNNPTSLWGLFPL